MRHPFSVVVGCLFAASALAGRAATYTSNGTGGELLSTAQPVANPSQPALTDITGGIALVNGISTGNMFEIYISQPALFSASTAAFSLGVNNFDTQLFLFSPSGVGVVADDDDPSTGHERAVIPAGSSEMAAEPAGNYYLLLEGGGRYPDDAEGNLLFPNFTDGVTDPASVVGPTGAGGADPLAGFTGNSGQGGSYSITLTGAEFIIPEPATGLLLALGGMGCCRGVADSAQRHADSLTLPHAMISPLSLSRLAGCAGLFLSTIGVASAAAPEDRVTDEIPANLGRGLFPLVEAFHGERRAGKSESASFSTAAAVADRAQVDRRQRVLVEITRNGLTSLAQTRKDCENAGGSVTAVIDWYRHGILSAWVPLKEVEHLARLPGISAVHLAPRRRLRIGAATSQGTVVLHTAQVNTSGYLGSGVTVGVLSDSYNDDETDASDYGFTTASQDVATGDLPGVGNPDGHTTPVVVVKEDDAPQQDTDEGRAMLQIVHDIVPAAKLAFATCGATDAEFAANIATLQSSAGCQVMCDDIGFDDEPMFSDGVIAQAINSVAAKGVTYFSAFGNDGNSGYQGAFTPVSKALGLSRAAAGGVQTGGIAAAEANVIFQWHAFGTDSGGNPVVVQNIKTGAFSTSLCFQWDDPFDVVNGGVKGITSDFDLLVFNSAGTYLASRSGTANNIGTNEPIELPASNLSANTSYKICIVLTTRVNGTQLRRATHLRYLATDDSDTITGDFIHLNNVSAQGHPYALGSIGVGAYVYDAFPNPGSANHPDTPVVESYSSNGPIDIYFDSAGNRLSSPVTRKQPVLSAVDNVDTTFFPPDPNASPSSPNINDFDGDGFPNFAGTSAATPHAAGIAALLINAASVNHLGTLSPQDIQSILISTAQGSIDEDPIFSQGVAGPVMVSDTGDNDAILNTFAITFSGTTGQSLTKLVINLSPLKLHFDPVNGNAFAVTGATGSPAPGAGTVTYSGGSTGHSSMTIPLTGFAPGDTLSFTVSFDDDATSTYGNDADELAGATLTATVSGVATPYTGTFANKLSHSYNYKAGYGLIDAEAALGLLLGQ